MCADDVAQSTKTSQLKQFKKTQKCYADSVADEYWEVGLNCAKSSLNLGRNLFSSGHKNIVALTHNCGLMLAKNKEHIKAVKELEKAYQLYKKHYGRKSEKVGWLLLDQANYNSRIARKNYLKALDILSILEAKPKPIIF